MNSESSGIQRPFVISPRQRMRRHIRRFTPLLVWTLVLIITIALQLRQVQGSSLTGYAEEIRYSVAAEAAGRLAMLEVDINQEVRLGQIIASFDSEELLLQLEECRIELDRLAGVLQRERALLEIDSLGRRIDREADLRRYARDVERAHIQYLDALADLGEDRIELQGLELTLNRTNRLQESDIATRATQEVDRVAFEALGERVVRSETMVEAMHAAYREAEVRYRLFQAELVAEAPDADLLLGPLESAIGIQEVRIERAILAIGKLVLRAPVAGHVEAILSRAGEMVAACQPVITILKSQSTDVVAFIPEHRILEYQPGTPVKIRRVADPNRVLISSIECLGAGVEKLPPRFEAQTSIPSWGLAVFIPLPDSIMAKPGEAFGISF